MKNYATLHELLANDAESRRLYEGFAPGVQVALQEQRQNIHTRQELESAAEGIGKQTRGWQAN